MGFDQNSYYITKYDGKSQFLVGKLSVRTRAQLSGAFPLDMKTGVHLLDIHVIEDTNCFAENLGF